MPVVVQADAESENNFNIKCFMDLTWWITILILFRVPFIIKNSFSSQLFRFRDEKFSIQMALGNSPD